MLRGRVIEERPKKKDSAIAARKLGCKVSCNCARRDWPRRLKYSASPL